MIGKIKIQLRHKALKRSFLDWGEQTARGWRQSQETDCFKWRKKELEESLEQSEENWTGRCSTEWVSARNTGDSKTHSTEQSGQGEPMALRKRGQHMQISKESRRPWSWVTLPREAGELVTWVCSVTQFKKCMTIVLCVTQGWHPQSENSLKTMCDLPLRRNTQADRDKQTDQNLKTFKRTLARRWDAPGFLARNMDYFLN
jgi:hypothetical protein